MTFMVMLMLTTLVIQIKTESLIVDNNQYLFYNKVYHNAKIAQLGTTSWDIGTWEHELNPNQLWTLKPHPSKKGCYYIVNEVHSRFRLTDKKHNLVVYSGYYFDDQLFKFVPNGDEYYYISSCLYPNDRITMHGHDNLIMYRRAEKFDDQLWRLVPRFKKAKLSTDEVFHFDNRQGSTSITREVTVTHGITRSSTSTIRSMSTFRQCIEASISGSYGGAEAGLTSTTEFTQEVEKSFSSTEEKSWLRTETILFTIPAGKNFKVMQHKMSFKGQLDQDSCSLLTKIKIFESTTADFKDDDGFIIKSP